VDGNDDADDDDDDSAAATCPTEVLDVDVVADEPSSAAATKFNVHSCFHI